MQLGGLPLLQAAGGLAPRWKVSLERPLRVRPGDWRLEFLPVRPPQSCSGRFGAGGGLGFRLSDSAS